MPVGIKGSELPGVGTLALMLHLKEPFIREAARSEASKKTLEAR